MVIGDRVSMRANIFARQGETITRVRKTSSEGSMGDVTAISSASKTYVVVFGNISQKDSQIREMGLAKVGNMKLYFTKDQDIITEDEITRSDGVTYRVETIVASYNEVYSVAIVKSMSLN